MEELKHAIVVRWTHTLGCSLPKSNHSTKTHNLDSFQGQEHIEHQNLTLSIFEMTLYLLVDSLPKPGILPPHQKRKTKTDQSAPHEVHRCVTLTNLET